MRKFSTALALTVLAAPALGAPADILDANKAATAGTTLTGKQTLTLDYAYSGQGMTGKVHSQDDLENGYFADNFAIGPMTGGNGYDGMHAWAKDPSGTVTQQDGGDQRQLGVNEAYRRANLWWRADRGHAVIVDDGTKTEGGASYDVLTVTPPGGKNFDAWFDARTHLLVRIVEKQGPLTMTTTLSDYRTVDGVALPGRQLVNNGDAHYDQTMTLTTAQFGPRAPQSDYAAPAVTLTDYTIAGGAKETSFPFQLINNHIYADVTVNGQGPYLFIFDTGGVNFITPQIAAALGLKTEGKMEGGGAGSGHVDYSMTKVDSLALGGASLKSQVFVVMPFENFSAIEGLKENGMVGYETFRRFVTRVDYGSKTLTLIDPAAFDAKDAGTAVPITFNGNTIEVRGYYDGKPGNFTVDTGSRASLTLASYFVNANKLRATAGKGVEAVTGWGVGGASRAFATRGKELLFGSQRLTGEVAELSTDTGGAFGDSAVAGNIGAGILKRYVVTLDYAHSVMYLKPVAGPIDDLDTFDRAGLWMNADDIGFKVVDVTHVAPAEEAGLMTGDDVVSIDGVAASALKLYDVRAMLRDKAPGTVVRFTVKRNGATKEVAVTLRDLI